MPKVSFLLRILKDAKTVKNCYGKWCDVTCETFCLLGAARISCTRTLNKARSSFQSFRTISPRFWNNVFLKEGNTKREKTDRRICPINETLAASHDFPQSRSTKWAVKYGGPARYALRRGGGGVKYILFIWKYFLQTYTVIQTDK